MTVAQWARMEDKVDAGHGVNSQAYSDNFVAVISKTSRLTTNDISGCKRPRFARRLVVKNSIPIIPEALSRDSAPAVGPFIQELNIDDHAIGRLHGSC